MNGPEIDDETLMAYADGALDPDQAQVVARAEATDPDIADRIRMFRETGALLGAIGNSRVAEPISKDLTARVERILAAARRDEGKTIVPFASPRPAWRPMALAASVALAVGALGGILAGLGLRDDEGPNPRIAVLDDPVMATALNTFAAGERGAAGGGEMEIIASFLSGDGTFCREFEYDTQQDGTIVSVACMEEAGWQTRFAVMTPRANDGSYTPASSLEALDAYLSAIGAGAPMSAETEAAHLSQLAD